jgi:hypothetical protein
MAKDGGNMLPQADQVHVPKEKITLYLLNPGHRSGQSKARFFISQGFRLASWKELAQALREHARTHPVAKVIERPHGTNYVIEGELNTPSGKRPHVRSVWAVMEKNKPPRLVTAYPIPREKKP